MNISEIVHFVSITLDVLPKRPLIIHSNLLQEKIHHCLLSKRCRPHERSEAPFILFAEQ